MLKEICITPQVFDSEHINNSNWKDLKNLLENIESSGYIVGPNNKDWIKVALQNISKLEQKLKDKFNAIFDILKDRQRIVGHPKSFINPLHEDDWINIIKELDDIRPFHSIIATKSFSQNSISLDNLENMNISEKFGLTGSKHFLKTQHELEKIFIPLLSYAKKVTIIDPYFDISAKRYKDTINAIAKSFMERRGAKENGTIIINCSSKMMENNDLKNWQTSINNIFKNYNHIITINVWDRKIDSLKLHDRYIITNQSGLVSAAGTDKDDYQQSEWSIKDYLSLNEILSQYKENSSPFELKYIITANKIERK